jgi:polyphenol oxidase
MPATLSLIRPRIFEGQPGIVAGFTTRAGGVSAVPFASLNLGLSTGADRAAVLENRRRLVEALGFPEDALATGRQVHGTDVEIIQEPGHYEDRDGLVTNRPDLLLAIFAADCAAILLADAEAGVIGACHAGWRGAAGDITTRTIEAMSGLGASPERMRAYVAPCISTDRFEVGDEVAVQFDDAFVERRDTWEKPHVDLRSVLAAQVQQAGIDRQHIEVDPSCTTDTSRFFSYRFESGTTGRMMGFIGRRS